MTPVIFLSDGYLANGAEPWLIPNVDDLPTIAVPNRDRARAASSRTCATRRRSRGRGPSPARPASSTASAASRRRTSPATSATTRTTTSGCSSCARRRSPASPTDIPPLDVDGPAEGDLLVLGWGGTYGAIRSAVERLQAQRRVGRPRPPALPQPAARRTSATCSKRYKQVLIPELNLGQLLDAASGRATSIDADRLQQGPGQAVPRSPRSRPRPSGSSRRRRAGEQRRRAIGTGATATTPTATADHRDEWRRQRRPAATELPAADPQGLRVRPGSPLVPRLRRLLDPRPDAEGAARLRRTRGEDRVHLRHRLLQPLPVLHEHLRLPHASTAAPRRSPPA